ncbi:hypothetical protein LINGRAHAP2_LOCUS31669 [Linum grandiflorum]
MRNRTRYLNFRKKKKKKELRDLTDKVFAGRGAGRNSCRGYCNAQRTYCWEHDRCFHEPGENFGASHSRQQLHCFMDLPHCPHSWGFVWSRNLCCC